MAKAKEVTAEEQEEITEFNPDEPHPETPPSVLAELDYEEREYQGQEDDAASEDTWEKLKARKSKRYTLVLPDPDNPGDKLTFTYSKIGLGHSMLVNDIAIVSGVIFNTKHQKPNDTMEKAYEEGRLPEYLEVQKNNRYYENKVMSIGLGVPIEEVEEEITHSKVRNALFNKIRGGAVPRLDTDEKTDVDIFPREVEEQASGQKTQTG